MVGHQECRLPGSGNEQTQPAVAMSTTMCSGTTQARGSPTVPEVSACRRPETLTCVLSNLQCWLWWQAATLAESPPSAPSVTPLLTRKSAGDACVTASTVPASAPVDTGGGYGRGGKAVHVSAARSKGNESRVGVPLSLAPAMGRTTSSGGNCFRFTRTRFFIFFLFICVLHFFVSASTEIISAGTQTRAHLWGAWSPLCRLLWFAVLAVLVPLDLCSSEAMGPPLRTGSTELPDMLVGEMDRARDYPGSPHGMEVRAGSVLSTYNWVKTSAPYGEWNSITSSSTGQYLTATMWNSRYSIYTSRDYGSTWAKIFTPFSDRITSSSTGEYLATAYDQGIYTSSDYGSTWTKTTAPTEYWDAVTSSSTGQYLAATAGSGGIYTSNDYGSTWKNTSAPDGRWGSITSSSTGQYLIAAMCIDIPSDDYYFSSIRDCGVYTSSDYGSTWTRTSALTGKTQYSLASSDTGQYLAAMVYSGGIYTSTDYGATWTATSAPTADWTSLASSSTGQYLAAAVYYNIYISSDYGSTWVDTAAPDLTWTAVALSSTGQHLVAAVKNGRIYKFDLFPMESPSSHPTSDPPSTNCTAGMFNTQPGACSVCPAGTFSTVSMSTCRECVAGYYSGALSASCTICPAGFYCLPGLPTGPVVCPAGTISPPGASFCTPCPAGHYSNSSSSCVSCPAGFYCLPGSPGGPGMCPAGTISTPGASVCTPCAAGQYSYPGASECLNCSSA
jgi:photosystem II stability/assembly factor-like uncharacterized protein